MKAFVKQGLRFIRKNPTIIFSLLLIAAVTAIIFFNAYIASQRFQTVTDALLRSKAALSQKVMHLEITEDSLQESKVAAVLAKVKDLDREIKEVSFYAPSGEVGKFVLLASSNNSDRKAESIVSDRFLLLASQEGGEGVAFVDSDSEGRFWTVAMPLRGEDGSLLGISTLSLSLVQYDEFVGNELSRVYGVAIVGVFLVLLLVLNHVRLFAYEVKATKLEEIDKMKDDFVSMASHELKTPLTAIRGYADILRGELPEDFKQRRYVENIEKSAARLNDLVEDILEVSRIEQNRIPISMGAVALEKVVEETISELSITAKEKGLSLAAKYPVGLPLAHADRSRVKQILLNLIGNAIKYTPRGLVEVEVRREERGLVVTVADTGLGMSAEQMQKLFGKFYRVATPLTAGIPGTGLGLWISRELARRMGGDITAESIEGVGTHMSLRLAAVSSKGKA